MDGKPTLSDAFFACEHEEEQGILMIKPGKIM